MPIHVVAAVVAHQDRVMVCRRRADRSEGGLWEFPGGKVEPGEDPAAALRRELAEELSITVDVGARLSFDETERPSGVIALDVYRAVLTSQPPRVSTDHDEIRWVTLAELGRFNFAPADRPAVRELTSTRPPR